MPSFLAACVQLCTTDDIEQNLATAEREVRRAAAFGAKLVCTPENTSFLGPQFHKVELAESLDGPTATRLQRLADELSIHLLVGGLAEHKRAPDGTVDAHRCFNTSVLYGPGGDRLATYRKMHLFDVDVPGGLTINESDSIAAGDEVVVADTPLGRIGLTICYDLRFPELYRALVDRGAELLAVPSAFTLTTGKDHWHVLLRARAIETQCWVLAPAQWGTHDPAGKRRSYGHSLIIDPWGCVVADRGQGVGLALAEVDRRRVAEVRQSMPVAAHRRLAPSAGG
ncbi:MAG: carbon-nitrogen hydrolase family protein [Myxococcota bacterium]